MRQRANTSSIPASAALARFHRPQTTVRWRLTFLYGVLFLASGAALLAITYELVSHATIAPVKPQFPHVNFVEASPRIRAELHSLPGQLVVRRVVERQRISDLHLLVVESGIALGIMALLSALLGWVVAGRVLAPLRTITATTQQISERNLDERLEMSGPRDELRQLGDTIDGLLGRLEVAFDAQRRFVANASHELRTPLAIMRTTLEVAAAKPNGVPAELKALEAALIKDLDHAERLLESFLVLARAEHGELGEQGWVSLEEIISAALTTQGQQIAAKEIEVHTALTETPLIGSGTLLARMVDNLIENAVRHNQPHGRIDIACEVDGKQVRLLIDSTGPILDEDRVAQLAQPFKRLGRDRTGSHRGHGLGLSIVAAIAAAHHGRLELHARPQGGLSIGVTLPAATLAEPTGDRA